MASPEKLKNSKTTPGQGDVGVVYVHYEDQLHLEESLLSLKETAASLISQVVVVDNGSSHFDPGRLKSIFGEIKCILNRENLGFGRANNQGLAVLSTEFVLLANPDTRFTPGALELLLNTLKNNPQAGAVGPLLSSRENLWQVSFGPQLSLWAEFRQKFWRNIIYARRLGRMNQNRRVGWLSAACLLARREALTEIGGFDEKFFLYFEDIDLCHRLRQHGWQLILSPQARVYHWGGTSTSCRKIWSRYHYRRSQLYFYWKHNSSFELSLLRLYLRVLLGWLKMKNFLFREDNREIRAAFKRLIRENFTDG